MVIRIVGCQPFGIGLFDPPAKAVVLPAGLCTRPAGLADKEVLCRITVHRAGPVLIGDPLRKHGSAVFVSFGRSILAIGNRILAFLHTLGKFTPSIEK